MGKLHPTETSVYDFEPGLSGDRTGRHITLEEGGTGSTIILSSQNADTAQPIPTASNNDYHWAALVKKILTPTYLSTLIATLRDHSSLPELVTTQLLQHLLKVYHHKVEVVISSEGMDSLDTDLPHFKLVSQRKSGTKKLELVFDDDKIKTYLKNSLSELFTYAGFWEEFARAIGANLIVWATENLEQHIGHATLTALQPEELTQDVSRSLLEMDATLLQERISFFGQIYCQDITRKIVKGFDLPNCSLQDMDKLLGLRPKPPTGIRTRLDLDPIAVLHTSIPIASSIRAQLRPDLWQ